MSVQPEPTPEVTDNAQQPEPTPEVTDNAQPEQAVGEVPVAEINPPDVASQSVEPEADSVPEPEPEQADEFTATGLPVDEPSTDVVAVELPSNFHRLPGGNVEMN